MEYWRGYVVCPTVWQVQIQQSFQLVTEIVTTKENCLFCICVYIFKTVLKQRVTVWINLENFFKIYFSPCNMTFFFSQRYNALLLFCAFCFLWNQNGHYCRWTLGHVVPGCAVFISVWNMWHLPMHYEELSKDKLIVNWGHSNGQAVGTHLKMIDTHLIGQLMALAILPN